MAGRWWRAPATLLAGVAAGVLATSAGLLGLDSAAAAPGTWGAGHYDYADGRVCRSGTDSSPLAAWTVDGGHLGYLTQAITSDGRVDSAAPPVAAAGAALPATPVSPGTEFGTDQDVAAVAYLLDQGGNAATLAAAVLSATDPAGVPACADTGAGALLAQARQLAGPYQVSVTPPSGRLRPGAQAAVTATVVTTAGQPVPGARVRFDSPDADFARSTATTDASGTAHGQVSVHAGAPGAVTITATTAVATGLFEATVTATPTATNPGGRSVPAVYPAPPTTFSGQASVTVDQTAHPVVSSALGSRLFAVDNGFVPRARVTGLNGHAADLTFDLLGPRPLTDRTLCAGLSASGWTQGDIHVAVTSTGTVDGDATAQGGALTPTQPGCYALRTTVATADAVPPATRVAPLVTVAVLDTTVSRDDDQPAVTTAASPGSFAGALKVGNTHGLTGAVQVSLVGPIRPADENCGATAPAWAKAPRHSLAASVRSTDSSARAVAQAGSYDYTVAAPNDAGCYRLEPAVVLTAPGGDRLTLTTSDARPAYVLDPALTAAVQRTWSVSPAAVPVSVEVDGLYGLAAHVHVAMYLAGAVPDGCGSADFAGARRAGDGPDEDVPARPGVQTVTAQSGPTPKQGCYAVVPELTLDANPRVRVTGTVGDAGATLIAGIDPNRHLTRRASTGGDDTSRAFLITMAVLVGVLLVVIVRVAYLAWRDRDEVAGGPAPRDVDRLGLSEDELPSPV